MLLKSWQKPWKAPVYSLSSSKFVSQKPTEDFWNLETAIFKEHLSNGSARQGKGINKE